MDFHRPKVLTLQQNFKNMMKAVLLDILETDINYPGQMGISHNKLPFLPSKMKINKKEN